MQQPSTFMRAYMFRSTLRGKRRFTKALNHYPHAQHSLRPQCSCICYYPLSRCPVAQYATPPPSSSAPSSSSSSPPCHVRSVGGSAPKQASKIDVVQLEEEALARIQAAVADRYTAAIAGNEVRRERTCTSPSLAKHCASALCSGAWNGSQQHVLVVGCRVKGEQLRAWPSS
jgi:hypothetical protein